MKKLLLILLVACTILWLCSYIPKCKEYFDVVYYDANKINEIRNMIPDIDNSSKFQSECNFKSIYDNTSTHYDTGLSYINNIDMGKDHISCCLVEKKFIKIPKNNKNLLPSDNMVSEKESETIKNNEYYMNSGDFEYIYTILEDEKCNANLYQLDSNKQLMIDGENGWSNDMCKINDNTNSTQVGSLSNPVKPDFSGKVTNIFSKEKMLGSCRYANKECFDYVTPEFCDKLKNQGLIWSEKTCNVPLDFKFEDRITQHVPILGDNGGAVNLFPQPDAIKSHQDMKAYLFPPTNSTTSVNKEQIGSHNPSYFSFYHPT
jgi:hypothetical protein